MKRALYTWLAVCMDVSPWPKPWPKGQLTTALALLVKALAVLVLALANVEVFEM